MQARTSLSLYHQNLNTNKSGLIPDSSSIPHLPSQSRSFSVGHSPSPQTSPGSGPTFTPSNSNAGQPQLQQQSTPVSAGKTMFRSFRNLLPFGPGKSPVSPNTSSSLLNPKRLFSLGQRPAKDKEKGGDKKPNSPIPTLQTSQTPRDHPFWSSRTRFCFHLRNWVDCVTLCVRTFVAPSSTPPASTSI